MERILSTLPLFPLQIVLLPGMSVPLHVFEERYKALMRECAQDQREFGINLVLGGRVHRIGCTAVLEEIIRRYADGRLDVRVRGVKKYRLTEEYSAENTPYFIGKVVYLDDEPDIAKPETRTKGRALLNEVLNRVYQGKEKPIFIFEEERDLSYQMAEYSGLDFSQRQDLLECPSERQRLEKLIIHYRNILEKLSGSDGHPGMMKLDEFRLN